MPDGMKQPRGENGQWVSIGDHIDRILAEREKRWADQVKAAERALQVQAKEYERRLTALNHAHEEAQRVLHTYVTIDKHEPDHERLEGEIVDLRDFRGRAALSSDLDEYKAEQAKAQKEREEKAATQRRANTAWFLTLAVSIAGLAIALFAK